MTAEIPLSRGLVAFVDDEDYDLVIGAGKWSASVKDHTAYAIRMARRDDGRPTTVRLHNFLTGWRFVDHVDGDGLNNQRGNLRPATQALNARNVPKPASNTSGFKGVTWHKAAEKWAAQIHVDGRHLHLGLFLSPHEAARTYDAAAVEYFGAFARLNFPQERPA